MAHVPPHSPTLADFAAASITHTMPIVPDAAAEPDYLLLPDAPAVCIFETPEGGTLLLATTASARDLARRRLSLAPAHERTSRADLRAICGRIHAIRIGSSLEADAVYLHQARERLPHLAKVVAERWRAWFVHVDFDAQFPQWTKTNLMIGLVGKRSASTAIGPGGNAALPPGVVLGPLPDKDAAGRLIENAIDCFDLCRYHHLLVQAPRAAACAYKEMQRCPAPCDGSESLERYRNRTCAATASITYGVSVAIAGAERAMKAAAANDEFEKAAAIQKAIARLRTLDKPAFAQVRPLHAWQELLILPGIQKGCAAVALFDRGSLYRVAEVDPQNADACVAAVRHAAALLANKPSIPAGSPVAISPKQIDTIGLVARWLFLAKSKRRGDVVPLAHGTFNPLLVRDIATKLVHGKGEQETGVESHEIEGGL